MQTPLQIENVLDILYEYLPSFKSYTEHDIDEDTSLPYAVAGSLARFLLDSYTTNDIENLRRGAWCIDMIYQEGTSDVQELVVVGYLESIQNVWQNNDTDPELFTPFLSNELVQCWKDLHKFWNPETNI